MICISFVWKWQIETAAPLQGCRDNSIWIESSTKFFAWLVLAVCHRPELWFIFFVISFCPYIFRCCCITAHHICSALDDSECENDLDLERTATMRAQCTLCPCSSLCYLSGLFWLKDTLIDAARNKAIAEFIQEMHSSGNSKENKHFVLFL